MAHEMGVTVPDVVKSGSGLAFIVFPDLVTLLPLPNLWALLFFIMLLALGLDTQFAMVETIMTAILDFAPQLRPKRTLVIAILCTILFLGGIVLTTPVGFNPFTNNHMFGKIKKLRISYPLEKLI